MAATLEARITKLEQAQASQEYPWLFIYGKPTPEQQARIDRATGDRPLICFWEDQADTVWLAGNGRPPPWAQQDEGAHHG